MWEEIKIKGRWHGEIWNRRKDEELYLQRMTTRMVLYEDGQPMRDVSVFRDISVLWQKDEHIRQFLLNNPRGRGEVTEAANRIVNSINEPIEILGKVVQIGYRRVLPRFPLTGTAPRV